MQNKIKRDLHPSPGQLQSPLCRESLSSLRADLEPEKERCLSQEHSISCSMALHLCSPHPLPKTWHCLMPGKPMLVKVLVLGKTRLPDFPCHPLVLGTGVWLTINLPVWQEQWSSLKRLFAARIFQCTKPESNNALSK